MYQSKVVESRVQISFSCSTSNCLLFHALSETTHRCLMALLLVFSSCWSRGQGQGKQVGDENMYVVRELFFFKN